MATLLDYEDVQLNIGSIVLSASNFYDVPEGHSKKLHNRLFWVTIDDKDGPNPSIQLHERRRRKGPAGGAVVCRMPARRKLPVPAPVPVPNPGSAVDTAEAAEALVKSAHDQHGADQDLGELLALGDFKAGVQLVCAALKPIDDSIKALGRTLADAADQVSGSAAGVAYLQQEQGKLGDLGSKVSAATRAVEPSVVIIAQPEQGKSYISGLMMQALSPAGLVDPATTGTELRVTTDHEERKLPAGSKLLLNDCLTYDLGLPLLIDTDAFNSRDTKFTNIERDSGLLLPHGSGVRKTACPVHGVQSPGSTEYVLELEVLQPGVAREVMLEAEEAVQKMLELEAHEGCESDGEDNRPDVNLQLEEALAILGLHGDSGPAEAPTCTLPDRPDRRVPGAYFTNSKLRWRVDARHVDAIAWINHALFLLVCVGNWGLVTAARLFFPSRQPPRGSSPFAIIDRPGSGQAGNLACTIRAEAVMQLPSIAAVIAMFDGTRYPQETLINELKRYRLPGRMLDAECASDRTPVTAICIRNVCLRSASSRVQFEGFRAREKKDGYNTVIPTLISRSKLNAADKAAASLRQQSQPLFAGPSVRHWIDTDAPDAVQWQPWLLDAFLDTLWTVTADAEKSVWKGRLQHKVLPMLLDLFTRASSIVNLNDLVRPSECPESEQLCGMKQQLAKQCTMLSDPSNDLRDRVEAKLRVIAPGTEAALPVHASGSRQDSAPLASFPAAWEAFSSDVTAASQNSDDILCQAVGECLEAAVRKRIAKASGKPDDPAYFLCKPGSKRLPKALLEGPEDHPELPELLVADLWSSLSTTITGAAQCHLLSCIHKVSKQACNIVGEVVFQPAAGAGDLDLGATQSAALIMACQQQFSIRLEVGQQDLDGRLQKALEELCSIDRRDTVFCDVMTGMFNRLYTSPSKGSLSRNKARLKELATWAPTAAQEVIDAMLQHVRSTWLAYQDQWVQRVQEALRSQAELAKGLLDGDWAALEDFPVISTWRHVQLVCANFLDALDKAQGIDTSPYSNVIKAARSTKSSDESFQHIMESTLIELQRQKLSNMPSLTIASPPQAAAAGQQQGSSQGASHSWTCWICGCCDRDCPEAPRAITKPVKTLIGSPAAVTIGSVCRSCSETVRWYVTARKAEVHSGTMAEGEIDQMVKYVCSIRRPNINLKRRKRSEPELPQLDKCPWPWTQKPRSRSSTKRKRP